MGFDEGGYLCILRFDVNSFTKFGARNWSVDMGGRVDVFANWVPVEFDSEICLGLFAR